MLEKISHFCGRIYEKIQLPGIMLGIGIFFVYGMSLFFLQATERNNPEYYHAQLPGLKQFAPYVLLAVIIVLIFVMLWHTSRGWRFFLHAVIEEQAGRKITIREMIAARHRNKTAGKSLN